MDSCFASLDRLVVEGKYCQIPRLSFDRWVQAFDKVLNHGAAQESEACRDVSLWRDSEGALYVK